MGALSRLRSALPWLLALAGLAAGVGRVLATHPRVPKTIPLPPPRDAQGPGHHTPRDHARHHPVDDSPDAYRDTEHRADHELRPVEPGDRRLPDQRPHRNVDGRPVSDLRGVCRHGDDNCGGHLLGPVTAP